MTARRLNIIVAVVAGFLLLYLGAAAVSYYDKGLKAVYFKDMAGIAIGLAVALLSAAFQRRLSYLQALRDLWKLLLPSIQTAIQYTHVREQRSDPADAAQLQTEAASYARAQESLSIAIDAVRGVFRNIPSELTETGLYPYENLKDIKIVLGCIAPTKKDCGPERCALARRVITRLWQETHSAILVEFDAAVPLHPVSKYLGHKRSIADYFKEDVLEDHHLHREQSASRPQEIGRPTVDNLRKTN